MHKTVQEVISPFNKDRPNESLQGNLIATTITVQFLHASYERCLAVMYPPRSRSRRPVRSRSRHPLCSRSSHPPRSRYHTSTEKQIQTPTVQQIQTRVLHGSGSGIILRESRDYIFLKYCGNSGNGSLFCGNPAVAG